MKKSALFSAAAAVVCFGLVGSAAAADKKLFVYTSMKESLIGGLKAGFIKMFVFNSQEANSTTDQITGAAKDANVPIVELAEQMPKQYTNLLDWMSALVDQFAAAVK